MTERAYTVGEIDALRQACTTRWLFGTTNQMGVPHSRAYYPEELAAAVESLVRTHMQAGHVADDLYAAGRPISSPPIKTGRNLSDG